MPAEAEDDRYGCATSQRRLVSNCGRLSGEGVASLQIERTEDERQIESAQIEASYGGNQRMSGFGFAAIPDI